MSRFASKAAFALLAAFLSFSHSARATIYGDDNRKDVYELTDPIEARVSDAAVALFWEVDIERDPKKGVARLKTQPMQDVYGTCESEPFNDEPSGARCSGSLIGPDLILTAGHCAEWLVVKLCGPTRFVFGYAILQQGTQPTEVPLGEVYSCGKIVTIHKHKGKADFAVIQLDRPVVGHRPLELETLAKLAVGDPLMVMGNPLGLPTKVAGGAHVRSVAKETFLADLDTYAHSSGSAVVSATTGKLVGVLDDGDEDFVTDPAQGCQVSKRCTPEGCEGEISTRSSVIAKAIKSAKGVY